MGYGHSYKCTQCGNHGTIFLDVGMRYPQVCEKVKASAMNGKRGAVWQRFLSEHPYGVFDCSEVIFACECGGWRASPKLDYYVAEDDSQEFPPYFTGSENYPGVVKRSQHRCPKCRKNMKPIDESKITSLKCQKCGGTLEFELHSIMWD